MPAATEVAATIDAVMAEDGTPRHRRIRRLADVLGVRFAVAARLAQPATTRYLGGGRVAVTVYTLAAGEAVRVTRTY